MTGFVHSVDKNQSTVMDELKQAGVAVVNVSAARYAGFDFVACFQGINLLVECKRQGEKNRLRPSERRMAETWPGPYLVASTAEDVIAWFNGSRA